MNYLSNLCLLLILLQTQAIPIRNEHELQKQVSSKPTDKNTTGNTLVPQRRSTANDLKWPGGIVYYKFVNYYPVKERNSIVRAAMNFIEKQTCIKFQEVSDESKLHFVIRDDDIQCSSTIGYTPNFNMLMNLNSRKCDKGQALHELMHILGFFHEHTRLDRDDKVKILWNNVKNAKQFEKLQTNNLDLPYDYQSIMQLKPNAFSKTGEETIQPLFSGARLLMGQRTTLTTIDVVKINRLYDCRSKYMGTDLWKTSNY